MTESATLTAEEMGASRVFMDQGTLMYAQDQIPLTEEEWRKLETLLQDLDYDHIVGGDASEAHSVRVCRFFNDVKKPEALHSRSEQIHALVMSPKMRRFYRRFTGNENLCLRRCQANLMEAGDFIGVHKDQDSNPDYIATAVFHFGYDYRGGDFVTHGKRSREQRYHPSAHTVLVNNCVIPHEVSQVERGRRLTLACFLSTEFGASRNSRQNFQLEQPC